MNRHLRIDLIEGLAVWLRGNLKILPTAAVARFWKKAIDTTKRQEPGYYKTLNLQFLDNGEVRIGAAVVGLTRKEIRELASELHRMGYSRATWKHDDREHDLVLSREAR